MTKMVVLMPTLIVTIRKTLKGYPCDRLEADILESLHPPHLALEKTLLHGFPYKPTALAFEPVQHLLAIGNRVGQVGQAFKRYTFLTFRWHCHTYEAP